MYICTLFVHRCTVYMCWSFVHCSQCTLKYNVVYLYFNCTLSMSRLVLMSYVIKCTKPNQDLGQVRNQCILTEMSSSISLERNVCMSEFRVNLDNKTMLVPISMKVNIQVKISRFSNCLSSFPPPQIMFNL